MSDNRSVLSLRAASLHRDKVRTELWDRRATPAELEFVRTRARQAARAIVQVELQRAAAMPDEDRS